MIQTAPAPPALTITAPGVTGAGITNGGKITITDATFIDVANGLQIGIGIGPENGALLTQPISPLSEPPPMEQQPSSLTAQSPCTAGALNPPPVASTSLQV
jgi:hypothetical protein